LPQQAAEKLSCRVTGMPREVRCCLMAVLSAASAANLSASELAVPVVLWDQGGKPARGGSDPARYVIGSLSIGGRAQHFTFDAGNPKQPILLAESCKGCSSGCPSTVPQCSSGDFCWPSHSGDYAPKSSYKAAGSCPSGVKEAGTLDGVAVCMQCFGGSSHSRFYTMAQADVSIAGTTVKNLKFGALVRVAPAIDRVWSNVGVGYKSAFMAQIGASSVLFHLRASGGSEVIFNPSPNRYKNAPRASFDVEGNRVHTVKEMRVGKNSIQMSTTTFHMDTGDAGIGIASSSDLSRLNAAARGYTPSNAPPLTVMFNGVPVTVPGSTWVIGSGRTVFFQYHKNVLGLPFLSSVDVVFDDNAKVVYFAGGSPAPPSPPGPAPAPPSPPSGCMQKCSGSACDCECFCSCGGVCGNGCYDKCRSTPTSCHSCPTSSSNLTVV